MRQIHILVEGQTEERVVNDILQPDLLTADVWLTAVVVKTKRPAGGASFRGGVSHWSKIEQDLHLLLHNSSIDIVTTMFDYYGLPEDTPGMADRPLGSPYERVMHVEQAMAAAIGHPRFLPFLALHETEAWVLAAGSELAELVGRPKLAGEIQEQVDRAGGPELVNDGPTTAPSKRLQQAHPQYQKVVDGPDAISLLGLSALRAKCPHLDAWLRRLAG